MSSLILRLIEVENFMGHEYERLELGPGVTLFAGASGNGKSSLIVDAPGFALFDYRATRVKTKAALRRRGSEGKGFRVKVAFERSDGLTFEVERGMKDNGSVFVYSRDSVNGDTDFEGTSQVHAHLVSLIGFMNAETYRRSFLTEQHSHGVLTDMQKAPRKAFVNRTLGIDIFSDIVKAARSESNVHAKRLKELQELLGGQSLADLERDIETQDELIERVRAAQIAVQVEKESAHDQAEDAARQLAELASGIAERQQLERQRSESAARLAGIDGRLAGDNAAERERMQELVASQDQLVARGKALALSVKEMEAAAERAAEHQQLAERAQQDRQAAERAEGEVGERPEVADIAALAELRSTLDAERAGLMAERADATRQIETARAGTCVTCGRDYEAGEAHEHEQQLTERLARIEADLTALTERQDKLGIAELEREQTAQQLALFEQRSRAAAEARSRSEAAKQKLESFGEATYDHTAHEQAKEDLTELRMRNERVREAKTWLAANPDPSELRTERDQLAAALKKLDEHIAACPDHKVAAELSERERALRRSESDLAQRLQAAASEAAQAQRQGEVLAGRLSTLGAAAREAAKLHQEVKAAIELADLTEAFWKRLSDEIRPQLSDIASDLMNRISHGTHPLVELTDDYDLIVHDADGSTYDAGELSGGEKDRLNFAMRIALTRLITARTGTPLGYLVLDEIFAGQDEGHIERMIDILDSLQAHYPQMFLISHAPIEDYEIVRYKVDVTERTGRSRVQVYSR